jgi:magnesium transporter
MITAWLPNDKGLEPHPLGNGPIPDRSVWLDVVEPTDAETALLQKRYGIELPTRIEMQAIEASSRLYHADGAIFMTATLLVKTETIAPEATVVTFIMVQEVLLTIRFAEPWTFRIFAQRAPKSGISHAEMAFITLLEVTVERIADMLEMVSLQLEHVSKKIFVQLAPGEVDLQKTVVQLGHSGNIISKARESLVDKIRLVIFAMQCREHLTQPDSRPHLDGVLRDLHSLSDHASFIAGKVAFLLDATLGLINIEQNRTIKIFSIVAVVFMPPTLIASIYGMNFQGIPEIGWKYGYEYGLGMMVASVVGTVWYFKHKRWM